MNMQDVQKWMGDNKTDAALRDHNAEIEGGGLPSGRMSIKTGMGMILTRDPKAAFQSYADTRDKLAAGFHNNPSNQQKTSSRQSLQKQLELCVDFSQNIETWCKYNQQAMHNLETAIKETQQANVLQDTDASMYNSLESYSACVENTIKILMRQNAAFEHLAQTIIDVMKNMSNNSGAKG